MVVGKRFGNLLIRCSGTGFFWGLHEPGCSMIRPNGSRLNMDLHPPNDKVNYDHYLPVRKELYSDSTRAVPRPVSGQDSGVYLVRRRGEEEPRRASVPVTVVVSKSPVQVSGFNHVLYCTAAAFMRRDYGGMLFSKSTSSASRATSPTPTLHLLSFAKAW